MDFPLLLIVLLALPIAVAGIVVAVSAARRRARPMTESSATDPVHRLQAGTAATQDAAVHPAAVAPKAESARLRRAASGQRQTKD